MLHGYHNGRGNKHVDLACLCDFETPHQTRTGQATRRSQATQPRTQLRIQPTGSRKLRQTCSFPLPLLVLFRATLRTTRMRETRQCRLHSICIKHQRRLTSKRLNRSSVVSLNTNCIIENNRPDPHPPVRVSVRGGESKINMDLRAILRIYIESFIQCVSILIHRNFNINMISIKMSCRHGYIYLLI